MACFLKQRAKTDLVLDYELDFPPEKVWRALSTPSFREQWLPQQELLSQDPVSQIEEKEISYRMRDSEPPYLESVVSFQLQPTQAGGTLLRIVHGLADMRLLQSMLSSANNNIPTTNTSIMRCVA